MITTEQDLPDPTNVISCFPGTINEARGHPNTRLCVYWGDVSIATSHKISPLMDISCREPNIPSRHDIQRDIDITATPGLGHHLEITSPRLPYPDTRRIDSESPLVEKQRSCYERQSPSITCSQTHPITEGNIPCSLVLESLTISRLIPHCHGQHHSPSLHSVTRRIQIQLPFDGDYKIVYLGRDSIICQKDARHIQWILNILADSFSH